MIRDLLFAAAAASSVDAPTTWTFAVTSTYSTYSGHTGVQSAGVGGLADGLFSSVGTVWGSTNESTSSPSIMADFGRLVFVSSARIAPIPISFDGWGAYYTNGAILERSSDGSTWTTVTTISGAQDGVTKTIAVNAQARYIRLRKPSTGYVAVGDFWFT